MRVRYAYLADRLALVRMGQAFLEASGFPLPSDPVHMEATAKDYITGDDKVALLLEADGGKHGMLLAHVAASPLAPVRIADEICLWIDPDHRRGGGRMLLDAYEQWAVGRGAAIVAMHAPDPVFGRLLRMRGYREADTIMFREGVA
jgi:GNAT superfamily N-acetyltransferase